MTTAYVDQQQQPLLLSERKTSSVAITFQSKFPILFDSAEILILNFEAYYVNYHACNTAYGYDDE